MNKKNLLIHLPVIAFALAAAAQTNNPMADGGNADDYDMAPETTLEVVNAAVNMIPTKLPPGPFQPTWESLKENYQVPQWFVGAKFGLFMHWGLYSVPAHHNEWYEKHMYTDGADGQWHVEHFGPQDQFGYKDFIPLFTCSNWNPNTWAELFKKSGAKFVVPTAEHHENFALWDSQVTPFNAVQMGPHRDLIGDLSKAVRKQGLKFGVSNHGIENFQFINPPADMAAKMKAEQADLYDPKWADFYNVADRSDAACERFLTNWFARNVELIDKYHPDLLWFNNGVDQRYLDPLKLRVAAYYYNRAKEWGKEVSISTKKAAYAPSDKNTETIGSIIDFEKIGARSPSGIRTGEWQVDQPIGSTWGYTSDEHFSGPGTVINALADTVSKDGTLLLNLSPKANGTFPPEDHQHASGSRPVAGREWRGYLRHAQLDPVRRRQRTTRTAGLEHPLHRQRQSTLCHHPRQLAGRRGGHHRAGDNEFPAGKIKSVTMLGSNGKLQFTQDDTGLTVKLPAAAPCKYAYVLKITGLKMNPTTWTKSGNPQLQPGVNAN